MIKKILKLILIVMVFLVTACIKDTYDMSRLSRLAHYEAGWTFATVSGDVSLSDIVDSGDTVVFDPDNFVRIVFREDSVIDLKIEDFYDLDDMVDFNKLYTIGELMMDPFQADLELPLWLISAKFSPALRAQFVALDDGQPHQFPAFPETDLGEIEIPPFTGFEYATFKAGAIDVSVTNNLTAPLDNININLYETDGHIQIGSQLVVPAMAAGETQTATMDLAGKTLKGSLTASIVLTGSPGTTNDVIVDLDSYIQISVEGRDLEVESGRIVLPEQALASLDNSDTLDFDPGSGVELDEVKISMGDFSYTIQSSSSVKSTIKLTLPTALKSGVPLSDSIVINPNTSLDGTVNVDNTIIDLGTVPEQQFNKVPIEYMIRVGSEGALIDFNSGDQIQFNLRLLNPDFDYVKGYFGQQNESIDADSISLDTEDILNHITGDFMISDPSIKLIYDNSFSVPMKLSLDVVGTKNIETVDLNLEPFVMTYPVYPERDVEDSVVIDKESSSLPELISLPPQEIRFSGSVEMNPDGNTGLRDNYVFGDSRFLGSLEVEIPMEFSINNMQFTDTLENFLEDAFDEGSDLTWDDFELVMLNIDVDNGFPLGASVRLDLYDSINMQILDSIDASDIINPAPVDASGRATGFSSGTASIEFTSEFFDAIKSADNIIIRFTINTTNSESQDIKIYSDYRIRFSASLVLQPDYKFKL